MQRISIKDFHPPSILISVRNPRPYYASHHNISCWFKKIFFFINWRTPPLRSSQCWRPERLQVWQGGPRRLCGVSACLCCPFKVSKTFFQWWWISEAVKFWEDIIRISPSLHGWYPKKNGIYPPNLRIYKIRPIKPQFFWNHFHAR